METIEQFIDALGGTSCVASALDLPPSTVSSWKTAGSVPKWRHDALRALASEKSVDVPECLDRQAAA